MTEPLPFAVADTSVLLAAFNRRDNLHKEGVGVLTTARILVVSPLVLAELDYLLTAKAGETTAVQAAERIAALASLGQVHIAHVDHGAIREAADLLRRYQGQAIGLTDAVNAVLAWKLRSPVILSFDGHYRHTIGPRTAGEKHLEVLPQG
ncbi:PIN domain-containing protein [Streptomyces sp. NPDC047108]|uniref:type II toxin-antitoxin system VapC family toxin n=1 Tax=Streptomyces sp. NPDC047108 TaxID=3155025 RepID=UPI0033D6F4F8